MTEDILDIFPGLNERLGHIYHHNEEYLQSMEHENEWEKKMREVLDREQISAVDSYLDAIGITSDIVALIAYRQGMRDLIRVLMGGDCILADPEKSVTRPRKSNPNIDSS